MSDVLKDKMDNPVQGEDITLIVGVTNADSESVLDDVRDVGAEIEETLYGDYLIVLIEETKLSQLSELDFITHIEIEGEASPLEGNSNSPSAMTQ